MLIYSEMRELSFEVHAALRGSEFSQIREIGEKKWLLTCQTQKNEVFLLISLNRMFTRFHLSSFSFKSSSLTVFCKEIEKYLIHAMVKEVELLNEDRILGIRFLKGKEKYLLIFEMFSKRSNCYLVDAQEKVLCSFYPSSSEKYSLPSRTCPFTNIALCTNSKMVEAAFRVLEKETAFEQEKFRLVKRVQEQLKKAQQRVEHHLQQQNQGASWQQEAHRAELLKSYFHQLHRGMSEVIVEDWEQEGKKVAIPLDPLLEPKDQLKKRFALSQKLKRKLEFSIEWIKKLQKDIERIEMQKTLIEGISNPKDLEDFLKSQEKFNKKEGSLAKIKPKEHHFREFTTEKGLKIYVGKNDKDNERLTFIYGRGSDFWLHAADYPGSHVLLKLDKEKAPDEETLLDAMQLALYFSQARKAGAGEVTITQCKYLSKVKRGQIGQVNVSKNKTAYVRLDAMRLQRLLGRPPLF